MSRGVAPPMRGVPRASAAALALACLALAGCAMPGYQFPGGPSPWLPQGAPAGAHGPAPVPLPVPASSGAPVDSTGERPARIRTADAVWRAPNSSVGYAFARSLEAGAEVVDSVLVVCTGNVCRSPMAAALLAERAKDRHSVLAVGSAGIAALVGSPSPTPVVELMRARGIDISSHRGRQLTDELGKRYQLILVMESRQREFILRQWPELAGRVRRLGGWRGEDVYDPYGLASIAYAQCLAQIQNCLVDWEEHLFP